MISEDHRFVEKPREDVSCTIIVCTRDRPEQLDRCLEAVSRLRYQKFDVLVVDNAPQDTRSREVAMRWEARYCIEPCPGLSRARNRGARESDTEIVAYLDDDSHCEPEWLSALALEFADPKVMAVTGLVSLYMQGHDVFYQTQASHERRAIDRHTPNWFELANFGGIGYGNNMAFRRRAFDIWPGFDERLGRGALLWQAEEHYAFFSLIDRGYRVVYTPHAVISHPHPLTMEELRAQYLKGYSALAGYLTLLFIEQPRHRRTTLTYIVDGIKGVERTWRYSKAEHLPPRPCIAPSWRRMIAYLSGPLLYARACLQHSLGGKR